MAEPIGASRCGRLPAECLAPARRRSERRPTVAAPAPWAARRQTVHNLRFRLKLSPAKRQPAAVPAAVPRLLGKTIPDEPLLRNQ